MRTNKSRESRNKARWSVTNDVVSGLPQSEGRLEKVEDKSPARWITRKSSIGDRTGEGKQIRKRGVRERRERKEKKRKRKFYKLDLGF